MKKLFYISLCIALCWGCKSHSAREGETTEQITAPLTISGAEATPDAIPNPATTIEESAFEDSSSPTAGGVTGPLTWSLADGVLTISGTGAMPDYYNGDRDDDDIASPWHNYYSDSIATVNIQNGVTSIGNEAFYACINLTSVTIPGSVTTIGYGAFYYCDNLTSITIPNSVTTIQDRAFSGCGSLTSITIPGSVISIGEGAFYDCSSLTSITIPGSVTNIEKGAFSNCTGVTSITVDSDNTVYASEDEVLFDKSKTRIIAYPAAKTESSYNIPNSVITIGDAAFINCTTLTSIAIPNTVTSIEEFAFSRCLSLASITIGNSVTNIGKLAFDRCISLTSITIPNSVTTVGESAFSYCSSLTSITIPNSVTTIGSAAFMNCSSLTSITIGNSVTNIEGYAFNSCPNLRDVVVLSTSPPSMDESTFRHSPLSSATLTVPKGSMSSYKAVENWRDFGTITEQ